MNTNEITFPYHGCYTAKRSGHTWHYWIDENGRITCIERHYYAHYNGKDHSKYEKGRETKELFKDIEMKLGRKTDGWEWIDEQKEAEEAELLEHYPIDGSCRKMERTKLVTKLSFNGINRKVYRHIPTGNLYYLERGVWCGTNPNYCYNTETGERGKWF